MLANLYLGHKQKLAKKMNDGWKHRRRMAYIALIGGILFPILATYNKELSNISMAFYTFISAVVGGYIGFATYDDKWKEK